MTRRQRRLVLIGLALGVLGLAAALALSALRDSIVFFVTPSELAAKPVAIGQRLRIGGLVKQGSLKRDGLDVRFEVTDGANSLTVIYRGVLPDLFREQQGVVADGRLEGSVFRADSVLAKHDETYMPRELVDSLKKHGVWREGQGAK
jgi:cytochrome c-type biogenesis protein CcmE